MLLDAMRQCLLVIFFCFIFSDVVWQPHHLQLSRKTLYLLNPRPCFFVILECALFVYLDDSWVTMRTTNFMFCTNSETKGEVGPVKSM